MTAAAVAMIGCMSGATIMAPITVAGELLNKPKVAITVASSNRT